MVLDFVDIKRRKDAYNPDADFDRGVIRLEKSWGKNLNVKRNDIVSVKNGNQKAYYAVKFHPTLKKVEIALDYDQRLFLHVQKGQKARLILRKAWPLIGMFRFLWSYPDLKTRSDFKMTVAQTIASIILGAFLGVFLTELFGIM